MSLITRCPKCGTAFRIQPAQLAARSGRVRCGKCTTVFDAVSCLVGEQGGPPAIEPSPQLGLFDPSRRAAAVSSDITLDLDLSAVAPDASRTPPARPREAPPRSARPAPPPPAPPRPMRAEPDDVPGFLEEEAPPRRFNVAWTLLALLGLLALAAQLTIYFRNEIAFALPAVKPQLAAACEIAGCKLRLPHRADLMSIESSDLQADPAQANVIVLNAVLRNRAAFAQEYPALELTLTDANDQVVVRRVLRPADYLGAAGAGQASARGIPAGSEVNVRMRFDASRVRATGFRLFLFFP